MVHREPPNTLSQNRPFYVPTTHLPLKGKYPVLFLRYSSQLEAAYCARHPSSMLPHFGHCAINRSRSDIDARPLREVAGGATPGSSA